VGVRLKLDSRTGILMVVFRRRDGETGTRLPSKFFRLMDAAQTR
jgi:hypothetical protein